MPLQDCISGMLLAALLSFPLVFHQSGAEPSTTDVDLLSASPDSIVGKILRLSYDIQLEAKSLRLEAATVRSEAQSLRSEAQSIRSEAQTIRVEANEMRIEAQATQIEARNLRNEANAVREEAGKMREEAQTMMKQAFDVLMRAFAFFEKEGPSDNCSEIEDTIRSIKQDITVSSTELTSIVKQLNNLDSKISGAVEIFENNTGVLDGLDLLESTIENLDKRVMESDNKVQVQLTDILTSSENLTRIPAHLDQVDSALGSIEDALKNSNEKAESFEQKLVNKTFHLARQVEINVDLVKTVKTRQQSWMSEIRLISLHKMTDESNRHESYETGVITDGLVGFSEYHNNVRVYSAKASASSNEKIWIKLGGLFRVHKIQIWNIRHSVATARFPGTRILVDETYIGTAVGVSFYYDFEVSGEVYGSVVTLHQPRHTDMNVVEVQVWGCGPFDQADKFA